MQAAVSEHSAADGNDLHPRTGDSSSNPEAASARIAPVVSASFASVLQCRWIVRCTSELANPFPGARNGSGRARCETPRENADVALSRAYPPSRSRRARQGPSRFTPILTSGSGRCERSTAGMCDLHDPLPQKKRAPSEASLTREKSRCRRQGDTYRAGKTMPCTFAGSMASHGLRPAAIRVWTGFLELPGFHMRENRYPADIPILVLFAIPEGTKLEPLRKTRRICLRPALLRVEADSPLRRITLRTHPTVLFGKNSV